MRMYPVPTGRSWFQKHVLEAVVLAVLVTVVVLMSAIFIAERMRPALPEQTSERTAPAVSLVYGPSFNPGTGTVYDGGAYGALPAASRPINLAYGPDFNPGTGTVYDGGAYGTLASRPVNLVYGPDFNPGTGTVYDGR